MLFMQGKLCAAGEASAAGQDGRSCPAQGWELPCGSVPHTGPGPDAAWLVPGCVPGLCLGPGCRCSLGWACMGQ